MTKTNEQTTLINPVQFRAYQALLHPEINLYIQSHGETGTFALGFAGPDSEITKWDILFANFDTRKFPKPSRLTYVGPNLAYINITKERLFGSLFLYFQVNLPLFRDVKSAYYYDEITETETFERDEEEIDRLAKECTEHFMLNHIRTHCFLPENQQPYMNEFSYALKQFGADGSRESRVENLADRTNS